MPISTGNYYIKSAADTNMTLDVCGAADKSGVNVQVYAFHGYESQICRITHDSGDVYNVSFPSTGRFLDVSGGVFLDGGNVQQWDWNGGNAQKWVIESVGSNQYSIKAAGGWTPEGIKWYAPTSGDAVYRAYNPYTGDHCYTMSESEYDGLVQAGWVGENIGMHSG